MKYLTSSKFSFISDSLPSDTFGVVSFRGSEGISKPYRFEIMLVSDNLGIDFKTIMNNKARLVFHREEGDDAFYNGIIANFEQLHEINNYAFYRAYLVPKLWWLSITHHNQVFLDKTVQEFGEAILIDGGFASRDFEFRFQGTYDPVEYVCQYGESHLNFLSRWFEREGIYYYFEQSEDNEKVIFTDTRMAHMDSPFGGNIIYSPPSGLESSHLDEAVRSFHCRKNVLPAKVLMKDYNYRRPSLEITGSADVDKTGKGTVYFYHEHFRTSKEGNRLAKIRAENIICQGEEYYGESSVPYLLPGFIVTLTKHYREDFNQKYLIIDINHEGDQTGFLLPGISPDPSKGKQQMYYSNSFTAIPAITQFRPQIKTMKPKVSGTIVGRIDAEGSGQYAELDEMGRYKVNMPFDLSGRTGGKASSWIRMAQPYGGSNHGMHFPLHKGTEVLLTFVNGDPDRPIIAATVPNPDTPSPVTSANQTSNLITTAGGNKIHMEDQEGSQRIFMHSPTAKSTIRLGSTGGSEGLPDNIADLDEELKEYEEEQNKEKYGKDGVFTDWETMKPMEEGIGIQLATSNWLDISAQFKNEIILGDVNEVVIGGVGDVCIGGRAIISMVAYTDITLGLKHDFVYPEWAAFSGRKREVTVKKTEANELKKSFTERDERIFDVSKYVARESTMIAERERKIVNDMDEMEHRLTKMIMDLTNIVDNEIEVVKTRVDTVETNVAATADEVKSVGSNVEMLGDRVTNVAAHVQEVGTQVEDLGTKVTNAGAITRTGGVISDA